MRGALHALDPTMVGESEHAGNMIHDSTTAAALSNLLDRHSSILALSLACLGIYGVIDYLVTERYKEHRYWPRSADSGEHPRPGAGADLLLAVAGIAAGSAPRFFRRASSRAPFRHHCDTTCSTFIVVPLAPIAIALLAVTCWRAGATSVHPVTLSSVRRAKFDAEKSLNPPARLHATVMT